MVDLKEGKEASKEIAAMLKKMTPEDKDKVRNIMIGIQLSNVKRSNTRPRRTG